MAEINFPMFPYGGDYNPEQWPEEVWDEDMRLMGEANWNIVTLPVFGWVSLEPEEGVYTFEWLDDVLDRLNQHGIKVCFATATASVPAWVDQKYPDILVTLEDGTKRKHGQRQMFCPTSPDFQRLSTNLARKIGERYKDHPALMLWHVSNEYFQPCYCERCGVAFQEWLKVRYGSLEKLNERWYTKFWGHTYTEWSQIEPPTLNGEKSIQAMTIDYRRFASEALMKLCRAEAAVLREVSPGVPITTNMMGSFFPLDYREWAQDLDIVSWDCYPRYDGEPGDVAFGHSLMRGLRDGQPFMLMEQSPSQQNWAPYNRLKPPGQLRLQSFQTVAHGGDSVMYFQWRRGRAGIEKLHGAVMEHGGSSENRVFKEVAALGENLSKVGPRILGSRVSAKVAVLFDWENWWAVSASSGPSKDLDYLEVVRHFFKALHRLGVAVEVVSPKTDLGRFDVIVAPVLSMVRPDDGNRIVERVKEGATLATTFFSGFTDEVDMVFPEGPPGPFREVLGISVEESDALPPELPNGVKWSDGRVSAATLIADRIRLNGAEVLGTYASDFYAGEPAVTYHEAGKGYGYYFATLPDREGLSGLLRTICEQQGIVPPIAHGALPPEGVEVSERVTSDGVRHLYLLNYTVDEISVPLQEGGYRDLLTGNEVRHDAVLEARGVMILELL